MSTLTGLEDPNNNNNNKNTNNNQQSTASALAASDGGDGAAAKQSSSSLNNNNSSSNNSNKRRFEVTVCNIGDSRTIFISDHKLVFVTDDHKPSTPSERERIERCGGFVRNGRVDSDLAVSRAFGDSQFKRNTAPLNSPFAPPMNNLSPSSSPSSGGGGGGDPRNQKVIAVPDITRFTAKPGDMFLICCDGVFEGQFPTHDVVEFALHQLPAPGNDIGVVCSRVIDQAVRKNSKDNITCMCVALEPGSNSVLVNGETSFVPGMPFPRTHETSRQQYTKMAAHGGMSCSDALKLSQITTGMVTT